MVSDDDRGNCLERGKLEVSLAVFRVVERPLEQA